MTLDDLEGRVSQALQDVVRRQGQRDRVLQDLAEAKGSLDTVGNSLALEGQVRDLLNLVETISWKQTKGRIESLVNQALAAVFTDRTYKFSILQETKRGASSLRFLVEECGIEIDIWEEGGLGVADVIGFTLRVAYLVLQKPAVRRFLVWDEPFKNTAAVYKPAASRFVKQVSQDLDLQILLVTHDEEFIEEAEEVFVFNKVGKDCTVVKQ